MRFAIMNRMEARRYTFKEHKDTAAIISISDTWEHSPHLPMRRENNVKDVLFLHFDDVESGPNVITENDAEQIIRFVDKIKNQNIDLLIVHCQAGVSRSAGVCAAIKKYMGYDDMDIFENPKYYPNRKCYRTVLNYAFSERNN